MRAIIRFAAGLFCLSALAVAEPWDPAAAAAEMVAAGKRDALDRLLTERGTEREFQQAIRHAREAGVNEQAILEARFLYRVDKGDDAALVRMLPEFTEREAAFKLEDSAIFAAKEDWLAVIEYLKALTALDAGDRAAFKRHITEAFWLSPHQGTAFAPHIERLRTAEAMRGLKLDLTVAMTPVTGGEPRPLEASLDENDKALLLHFWSPWSGECDGFMPQFAAIAAHLAEHGVAVASLLSGDFPELVGEAGETIRDPKLADAGEWFIDPTGGLFARQLRVRDLPTLVLLSPQGEVLFNGAPDDKALWKALAEIDARIRRPQAPADDAR